MSETFEQLGMSAPLVNGMSTAGMTVPTSIQVRVIPLALAGKDIIGQSATGTGKTLAYLLPLFQKIDHTKRELQAIILAPTHELAIQILRQIELLAQHAGLPVTAAAMIGDGNIIRQIEKLKAKPHMVVGSSTRILELIQKKKMTAHTVKTIVLDEADRLLDDQNVDGVKAVIKTTLRERQLMLFSATITAKTLVRAQEFTRTPEIITVEGQADNTPAITHMYFVAERRDKMDVLRKLVGVLAVQRALVFINKSDNVDFLVEKLNYHGLQAAGIYANSQQEDRKKALQDFRNGKVRLLVASDLAARGLDIAGIDVIFNVDMPENPQVYLHRVGRTGRAGERGTAISIVTRQEATVIHQYEKALKITIAAKRLARGELADARF